MRITKAAQLSLNILLHSKLRSWLTIIGIVIGVGSVISIVSIGEGLQQSVQSRLGGLGADIITVSPGFSRASYSGGFGRLGAGGGPGFSGSGGGGQGGGQGNALTSTNSSLTRNDVQTLKGIPEIQFINPMITGSADLYYLGEAASGRIKGVDPTTWKYFAPDGYKGRLIGPSDTNVAVMGNKVSQAFKNPIDINKILTIKDKAFRVIGILDPSQNDDNSVFIPSILAREVLENKQPDRYDSLSIKAINPDAVDAATGAIEYKLMMAHHTTNRTKDFTVTAAKAIQQRVSDVATSITLFLSAIAAVSLLVGAVGVANTMFTAVLEKTREIGIMKAIGARNKDVLLVFLINAGLVGLVGGLLGIIAGIGLSQYLPRFMPTPPGAQVVVPIVTYEILIWSLVLSIVIGMLAGIIPAIHASRMNPVDALRYE